MQAVSTNDEQEVEDHVLNEADPAFMDALSAMNSIGRDAAHTPAFEAAAANYSKLALESGDELKLAFLFGEFNFFVQNGRVPPHSMLVAINEAFRRFRVGKTSLDQAFGLGRKKRGNRSRWFERQWGLQQAAKVMRELKTTPTLDAAVEKIELAPGNRIPC
jgi:hypothetical protein